MPQRTGLFLLKQVLYLNGKIFVCTAHRIGSNMHTSSRCPLQQQETKARQLRKLVPGEETRTRDTARATSNQSYYYIFGISRPRSPGQKTVYREENFPCDAGDVEGVRLLSSLVFSHPLAFRPPPTGLRARGGINPTLITQGKHTRN